MAFRWPGPRNEIWAINQLLSFIAMVFEERFRPDHGTKLARGMPAAANLKAISSHWPWYPTRPSPSMRPFEPHHAAFRPNLWPMHGRLTSPERTPSAPFNVFNDFL